jgi:hypothetical protein
VVTTDSDTPSVAIALAVAAREGVDPTELTPPLGEVVDPDALDALFDGRDERSAERSVTFDYQGYRVEVSGDATVDLQD